MCSLHNYISNTFVELARGHTSGFLWVCTLNALPDALSWTVPRTHTPDVSMAVDIPGDLSVAISGARLFHNYSLEKTPGHFHLNPPGTMYHLWQFDRGFGWLKPCLPSNYSPGD